jgi:hypothetical protein
MKNLLKIFGMVAGVLAFSCQGISDDQLLIKNLEKNPSNVFLSLTEVEWVLLGYGNDGNSRLEMPKVSTDDCVYRLAFKEGGEIYGRTCPNIIHGIYSLDDSVDGSIKIENFVIITEANESIDPWYLDRMNLVFGFQLTEIGLKLYYDDKNFVLFSPL